MVASGSPASLPVKLRKGKRRNASQKGYVSVGWIVMFSVLVLCCLGGYHSLMNWERQQKELFDERLKEHLDPMTREWEEKVMALEEEKSKLMEDSPKQEDFDRLQRQVKKLKRTAEKLRAAVQHISKTELVKRFGTGPYYVEIQLAFDPQAGIAGDADRILLEMASEEDMPHSVYWFMNQVDMGLFNGCSFHRNANHVVQGGPAPNFLSPQNPRLHQRFDRSGFGGILFQEYSPNYPHVQFTVGYAGRPGGPDFYVSIQDNTQAHGPGGQTGYDDVNEADPCFARVIEGHDAVERMHQSPVQPGDYNHMVYNVAITEMRIVDREHLDR